MPFAFCPSFMKSHNCLLHLMYSFINIQCAINHTPADKTRAAIKHVNTTNTSPKSSRHTANSLLNISSSVDQRPSTRNVGQSQLGTPRAVPASGGVTTVTALSGPIRVRCCWSRHPGWLSSWTSYSLTLACSLALSLSCFFCLFCVDEKPNHTTLQMSSSSRPMKGFEAENKCGFKGHSRPHLKHSVHA